MVGGSLRLLIAESGVKHNKSNNAGQLPGSPTSTGAPSYYMYVVYDMFLMIKNWFCWKYQYNKYMFISIDISVLFLWVFV